MALVVYAMEHPDARKLSRALLERIALQHWQITPPLHLERGSHGKPFLPDAPQHHFNISHSENLIVCALDDAPLGVDIQLAKPRRAAFLEQLCMPKERAWLRARQDSPQAFALLWTLKESRCKWSGRGLQFPISDIAVPLPKADERTLELDGLIFSLRSGPGWQFCLCSERGWEGELSWLNTISPTEESQP